MSLGQYNLVIREVSYFRVGLDLLHCAVGGGKQVNATDLSENNGIMFKNLRRTCGRYSLGRV